ETLDYLAKQGVHHLGLNPRALILNGERLWIADFGLAQFVWLPAGQAAASMNVRYSAPELAQRKIGPACDQYSLALIYHELLTAAYPAPAPARKGESAGLCVDSLPTADRMVVARALHPDPRHRWESALDLIRALESVADSAAPAPPPHHVAQPTPAPIPQPPTVQTVDVLMARFGTNLTADVIRQRLEGFRQQWQ